MSDFYALKFGIKANARHRQPQQEDFLNLLISVKKAKQDFDYLLFPPKRPNMPSEDSWISNGVPSTVVPACITRFLKVKHVGNQIISLSPSD